MRTRRALVIAAAIVLAPAPARVLAQHDHDDHDHAHPVRERLGTVHFPTSCRPEVGADFERAMALLHSFAYPEAASAFEAIAARDPRCAMAWWGVAMSQFHTIWGPPTPAEFAAGRTAADRAAALAKDASPQDRDWISAITAYYAGDVPHATRVVAFEQAMAGVAERHPENHEAQIFHALGLLAVAYNSPADKSYARQKRAAEILNGLLPLEPEHPGIAHYMIHAFDYPELAAMALPAARAYSRIAPSAPHALHMPSHIFTRLGMWNESIASNLESARVAQEWIAKTHPGAMAYEALHATDYLEYAYLQTGRDAEARALRDSVLRVARWNAATFSAGYALAAVPARFALERRAWKEAAALEVRPASFPWADYPYAEAIVHFARAVGAARSGDAATAKAAVARLETIRDGLHGKKGFDWATQVDVQRRAAAAWLARAEKRDDEALALLRGAAALEDSTDKHPVTPGAVLPAREQLGDLLLELGRPAEALSAYEASLRFSPARFNGYRGAALAARAARKPAQATEYQDRLVALCGGTVPDRVATAEGK